MSEQPEVVGRYLLYGKIASGGMASVHFGRLRADAGFSRTVAIKRLHRHLTEDHPEFLAAMLDEARLAARIHHPNVVPTLDVVTADGELLVVMEYVRGESLSALHALARDRGERMPLPVASAVIVGALHGLQAAHEATSDAGEPLGIVHRDVSPQNILVGVDGVARVIDFGVAKAAGRLQTTNDGVIKGKLAYMSPEQLSNGKLSARSDVYAMAVVLWEALAGRRLFRSSEEGDIVGQVLAGVRDPPSRHGAGIPPELDALVLRGLAYDPSQRFPSAREMADALMRVVPPVFPPDVAAWVEAIAAAPLARRSALLTEIERSSGLREPGLARPWVAEAPKGSDQTTVAVSQVSSVSVARDSESKNAAGRRRTWLGLALGGLALASLGGARLSVLAPAGKASGAPTMAPTGSAASALLPPAVHETEATGGQGSTQPRGASAQAAAVAPPGAPPSRTTPATASAPEPVRPPPPHRRPQPSTLPVTHPVDPLAP